MLIGWNYSLFHFTGFKKLLEGSFAEERLASVAVLILKFCSLWMGFTAEYTQQVSLISTDRSVLSTLRSVLVTTALM